MSSMPVSNLVLVVFFCVAVLPLLITIVLGILAAIVKKESLDKATLIFALVTMVGVLVMQILLIFLAYSIDFSRYIAYLASGF